MKTTSKHVKGHYSTAAWLHHTKERQLPHSAAFHLKISYNRKTSMRSENILHPFATLNKPVRTDKSLSILGVLPHELIKKGILGLAEVFQNSKRLFD